MNLREARIFNVLLNRYDPQERSKLLSFLQPEVKQDLALQGFHFDEIAPLLFQHQHVLERMHYSWLKPVLQKFPEELVLLVISSLSPGQVEGLKLKKIPSMRLSQNVKLFIKTLIYKHLDIQNLLPIEFLPTSEFSVLLNMDKNKLMDLVDFLGLHDLASEVRKIVNPSLLKNIYTSLAPKQFHYLKICMNQKDKLVSPPLGIDISASDSSLIKQAIHKRGLVRFGKALCGEHKDLVWYIAHVLDTGRGKILLSQYQPEAIPAITSFLQMQVMNVINFLKKE